VTTIDLDSPADVGRLERWTDWLNPILLKEVRQAMRGRYFKISFWFTLAVATIVGLSVCMAAIIGGGEDAVLGPPFFIAMFACLTLAAQVLVPFSSFLSMGSEWDENTWDLLVLSNLRPRQIVLGKVLSAGVQALLYYSAFGPFLVFAFLLRGIDMTALFVSLSISFAGSLLLSCLAVAMSSFSRARFARVLLLVLLAVALIQAGIGSVAWGAQLMFFPGELHDPEMLQAIGAVLTTAVAVAAFFFAAACARLAHPEENRSTGLRVMTLLVLASGLAWATYIMGARVDDDAVIGFSSLAFAGLGVASIFFSTEPERLGRRVAATLPKNRLLAWLATPFLPGGMRGLLFFIVGGGLISAWVYVYPSIADPSFSFKGGQVWIPPTILGYGVVYLGLPGAMASFKADKMVTRILSRLGILAFFLGSIILPTLFTFLLDLDGWQDWEHPGNIFLVVDHLWREPMTYGAQFAFVVGAVGLVLLLNSWRFVKMVREMRTVLRERT
jgi:hypothetical protein